MTKSNEHVIFNPFYSFIQFKEPFKESVKLHSDIAGDFLEAAVTS